jgi:hypothetical protein
MATKTCRNGTSYSRLDAARRSHAVIRMRICRLTRSEDQTRHRSVTLGACHRTTDLSGHRCDAPVRVIIAGREEAELWCGDKLLAMTFVYDGRLHLKIESRADGQPWLIGATSLALALDEAARQIAAF